MKKQFTFLLFSSFCIIMILCIGWSRKEKPLLSHYHKTRDNGFALLELFTSQGCSSCPPADALLAEYADKDNKNIIPLSFHVDYWDRLGWKDPFSTHSNSERQLWYSGFLPRGQVYTPQLVVNGKNETVGNNRPAVASLVGSALHETVKDSLSILSEEIQNGKLRFRYHMYTEIQKNQGFLQVALVKKNTVTRILRGENEGRTLINRNVVMQLSSVALQADGIVSIELPPGFSPEQYLVVAYLQKNDGIITAAIQRECTLK